MPYKVDFARVEAEDVPGEVARLCEVLEAADAEGCYGVLVNPLVEDGYPSIGCEPCTARVTPGADARSGRWAGRAKTECGIHA